MLKDNRLTSLRRSLAVAAAGALVLGTSACGGSSPSSSGPSADKTRGAGSLVEAWPLTGLPTSGSLPSHPIVIVKIDNTASSQPQIGLDKADLVTEELVEGGLTRLAVFYDSQIPSEVGPVRSMRASDVGIATPAHAVIVASGAAPKTVRVLSAAGIKTYTEGAKGFQRSTNRAAPYNLMMKLPDLVSTMKDSSVPPPYLPFGTNADFHGTRKITRIAATFSGGHTTNWQWKAGKGWLRPGSFAQPGHDFVPTNILILRVKVGNAGYVDPAGNPVPDTIFKGTGKAVLFHNGRLEQGTWNKHDLSSTLNLKAKDGSTMKVPAGKTWIELVPAKGGSVSWK
ncbi:MAG: DUF3048 domain-containing protein [Nocardioidaceae bacterium]